MKGILLACFLFLFTGLAAQITVSGEVRDSITSEPIPFVHVVEQGSSNATMTDKEGQFTIKTKESAHLTFSYVGYQKLSVPVGILVSQKDPTILLSRKNIGLDQVEVFAGENPAHRIIERAARQRSSNNPESLERFQYTSYEKMILSAYSSKDSMTVVQDSIADDELTSIEDSANYAAPPDTAALPRDSSQAWPDSVDVFDSTNLFLMETVARRYYAGGQRDKSDIIASRISGFKEMNALVLATRMQPFGFYNDRVQLFDIYYLNPISKGTTSQYFFNIRDTLYQGQDSIYVISFHPFKNKNFKGLKGVVYINTNGYAIQNIVAEPAEQDGTVMRIQQQYERHGTKWFPVVQKMDLIMAEVVLNNRKGWISSRRRVSDIEIDADISKKKLRGHSVEVIKGAYDPPDSVWSKYRAGGGLTRKEQNTYKFIDSVGAEANLDRKLKWLRALGTGKFRTGKVDWKLRDIIDYNRYESLRLGVGLETNEQLMERFRLGGHAAYGFGDDHFKYGAYGKWIMDPVRELSLQIDYNNDVFHAAGRPNFYGHRWGGVFEGDLYPVYVKDMFHAESWEGTFGFRLLPDLTGDFTLGQKRFWQPFNDYQLLMKTDQNVRVGTDRFMSNYASLRLRYAYGEKHARLLDEVISLGTDYPVVHFNLIHSFDDVGASNLRFTKVEGLVTYDVLFRKAGRTHFTLSGGWVDGRVPYFLQYFAAGSRTQGNLVAYSNAFNTMPFQDHLASSYVMLNIDHNFGNILYDKEWSAPSLHFEFVSGFGWNDTEAVHQDLSFTGFEDGYHEVGVSVRDLLLSRISNQFGTGLGIGAYYRFGPYNIGEWKEDLSLRLTYTFNRPDF